MEIIASKIYPADETTQASLLSTVHKNMKKVSDCTDVCLANRYATDAEQDDVKEYTKHLRQAQSALKKSLDRKRAELKLMGRPKLQSTPAPEQLTEKEMEDLVEEIKMEHVFSEEQVPDSQPSSPGSPDIPLLPHVEDFLKH